MKHMTNEPNSTTLFQHRAAAADKMRNDLQFQIGELQVQAYQLGVSVHFSDSCLVNTISANVDNEKLTDAEFRQFIRNSISGRK